MALAAECLACLRPGTVILLAALAGPAARAGAQEPARAQAQEPARVWVNSRSGVYHCAGTQAYGRTAQGEYMREDAARDRGDRANGGRACGPLAAVPASAGGVDAPGGAEGGPRAPVGTTRPCLLVRVADGDTIECSGALRVRLIGVDAPESDQEPFGTAATAGLAALVAVGATLELEVDAELRDRYGRLLAYAWRDGRMVNWELVRQGWAVALPIAPNRRHAQAFELAESAARREGRGLWRVDGFRCRPADRRRGAC